MSMLWLPRNPDELADRVLNFQLWKFNWAQPAGDLIIKALIDYKAAYNRLMAQRNAMYRGFRQNVDRHEAWLRLREAEKIERQYQREADDLFCQIECFIEHLIDS